MNHPVQSFSYTRGDSMQAGEAQIALLLLRSVAGDELEREEIAALREWLSASPHHEVLLDELMNEPLLEREVKILMGLNEEVALERLQANIARERRKQLFYQPWFRYAAAVVM